jgi:NADPH-dependent glutamate synthase beta subunit-like oxidoreductase
MLESQGGCKLCCVEIGGSVVQSCMVPAEDGMEVFTDTDGVKHLRQISLELLLASHPADCTSCSVYLKCELQNLLQYLGVAHSRLRRIDKKNTKVASGAVNPLMKREMERCVQCGRCVRVCGDLRGVGALEYRNRNGEGYVGIHGDRALVESDCRFCGACVEVCPTGAIQDVEGVFPADIPKARALTPCKELCPAHTDIFEYLRLAGEGKYSDAVCVIREKLTFPRVLGHVCTHKCEFACKRSHLDAGLSIREAKRYAVENDTENAWRAKVPRSPDTGKKIAVVGSGPAGLTAAWHLSRKGHRVTVFERDSKAGGMMRYGIPTYRLAREILDGEIEILTGMGMEIRTDTAVASVDSLKKEHDAVVLCVGAQSGALPDASLGELANVNTAVQFCRAAAEGELSCAGSSVAVVGGGNVAFDCALIAAKAGASRVRVLCLERREEMLADEEEIEAALEEGVELVNSAVVEEVVNDGKSASGIRYVKVKSFAFGPNGLAYESEENSGTEVSVDAIVYAMGQRVELDESFGVELGRGNAVVTDGEWQTTADGVFAAGDAVTGTKSIVEGIAAGSACAAAVDRWLGGDGDMELRLLDRETAPDDIGVVEGFAGKQRCGNICSADDMKEEALRCLQCDLRLRIPSPLFWGDEHFSKSGNGAGAKRHRDTGDGEVQ